MRFLKAGLASKTQVPQLSCYQVPYPIQQQAHIFPCLPFAAGILVDVLVAVHNSLPRSAPDGFCLFQPCPCVLGQHLYIPGSSPVLASTSFTLPFCV